MRAGGAAAVVQPLRAEPLGRRRLWNWAGTGQTGAQTTPRAKNKVEPLRASRKAHTSLGGN